MSRKLRLYAHTHISHLIHEMILRLTTRHVPTGSTPYDRPIDSHMSRPPGGRVSGQMPGTNAGGGHVRLRSRGRRGRACSGGRLGPASMRDRVCFSCICRADVSIGGTYSARVRMIVQRRRKRSHFHQANTTIRFVKMTKRGVSPLARRLFYRVPLRAGEPWVLPFGFTD